MKTNTPADSCMECDSLAKHGSNDGPCDRHKPDSADHMTTVADYLANLTLWELAEIGRPTTPPKKPEARFVRCDGDKFIYHVRGKNFHAHDRLTVQGLMRPKGHTDEEIKASALANAKELDKLLLREVAYSRKIIAANAVRRITETLKAEAP